MAKSSVHRISAHQFIESRRDHNGRYYIAYSGGASCFIRDTKELRRFLKLPKGLPCREAFDAWLTDLTTADATRATPTPAPDGLSAAVIATGFGPEAHLDESDPNHATRTII